MIIHFGRMLVMLVMKPYPKVLKEKSLVVLGAINLHFLGKLECIGISMLENLDIGPLVSTKAINVSSALSLALSKLVKLSI